MIAKELLEHETIDEKDLNRILDGKKVVRRKTLKVKTKRKKVKKSPTKKSSPTIKPKIAPA